MHISKSFWAVDDTQSILALYFIQDLEISSLLDDECICHGLTHFASSQVSHTKTLDDTASLSTTPTMADKLRELRALLSRSNTKLLSLRSNLSKESSSSSAAELLTGKTLQAFLVDTADAHQSEYVSDANKRRQFISGFTGSNGTGMYMSACM